MVGTEDKDKCREGDDGGGMLEAEAEDCVRGRQAGGPGMSMGARPSCA